MNDQKKKLTEEQLKLIEETERFMEEVNSDPEVANVTAPLEMYDKVFAEIRAREAAKREAERQEEKRKAEEQELIRLGKIYKKKRKMRKYFVLAAVLVFVLAFGITSVGGPNKVFEKINWMIADREQVNVDSDNEDVTPTSNMSEGEAYQEIEDIFGFTPVALDYLPNGVEFLEAEIGKEVQCINLVYGKDGVVKISYLIRPNYRVSSLGKDIEDEFIEEYVEENKHTIIYIRKYSADNDEERWSVQFEYCDVFYSLTIYNESKENVDKIVENLFFS